jgi:hypothetical protein
MNIEVKLHKQTHFKLIWGIAYMFIALSFIFIANDNTFFELLQIPSFYSDLIFSFAVTFGLGYYLQYLNTKLNKKYPWIEVFIVRSKKQILLGVLLPLFTAIFLEAIYLKCIGISISNSSILHLELPLALIFLLLLNLVYLANYLYKHKRKETIVVIEQIKNQPSPRVESIMVQKGFVEERIELSNCAFIVSANKQLWFYTNSGEKYRLQGTLEEWEEKLKHDNFYRLNRQFLSSKHAIQSVEQTKTRKLKVNFIIPTEDVYVSKLNVVSFRKWWKA